MLALSSIWRVKREISTLWYATIINNSIVGPRKLQQTKHRRHMERPICLSSRLISIYRQDQHYSSSSMQEAHAALDLKHLFCNMAVHHLRNSGPVSGPAVSCSAECRLPGRGFLNKETGSKSKGLHPQGNFGRGVRRTPSTLWERKRLPYSDRWKGRLLMREEASNSELCGFTSHKLQ